MTDLEKIEFTLSLLYNNGNYIEAQFANIYKHTGNPEHPRDVEILKAKIEKTGLAAFQEYWDEDIGTQKTDIIYLTEEGVDALQTHGNYLTYLAAQAKNEKELSVVAAELDIAKKRAEIELLKSQVKDYPNLVKRANMQTPVKLTTLRRNKLTSRGRSKLTTPRRSKLTTRKKI